MAFIRRILRYMRPFKRAPRRSYDNEVLYAGWVQPTGIATKGAKRR